MSEELVKLLTAARDEIKMLTEGESCDHSVGICMCATVNLLSSIDAALTAQQEPVAPKWYSRGEIVHILHRMKYSDEIAQELADWMARHLQMAFNKGFQIGGRNTTPPSGVREGMLRADAYDKRSGWTLSPRLLNAIKRSSDSDFMPDLESIEAVLLAYESLRAAADKPQGVVVPVEPTEAMLRPFWDCPADELKLAWQAMLHIVNVQNKRAAKDSRDE